MLSFLLLITILLYLEYDGNLGSRNIQGVQGFGQQPRGRRYPPPTITTKTEQSFPKFPNKASTPVDYGKNEESRIKSIWETSAPILVQANSLERFNFDSPNVERVQVLLKKADMIDNRTGRKISNKEPLIARVDLWHGPDSTPQNVAIYFEEDEDDDDAYDGTDSDDELYGTPFSTIIETPKGQNIVAIRNIAPTTDLLTCIEEEKNKQSEKDYWHSRSGGSFHAAPRGKNTGKNKSKTVDNSPLQSVIQGLKATTTSQRIDSSSSRSNDGNSSDKNDDNGKAVIGSCAIQIPDNIASLQVLLETEYMCPLQARLELELRSSATTDGTSRVVKRTIVEVYSEDGMQRPFFAVLETPRLKNDRKADRDLSTSIRVVNLSSADFPLFATIEPHRKDKEDKSSHSSVGRNKNMSKNDDGDKDEFTRFGGGSSFDVKHRSTIVDAEIL